MANFRASISSAKPPDSVAQYRSRRQTSKLAATILL